MFANCSKSPQKAATNVQYTKGAVGGANRLPPPMRTAVAGSSRKPYRRTAPREPQAAAPTSYCSPAHARQSPGGGQTTYPLPCAGVSIEDSPGNGAVFLSPQFWGVLGEEYGAVCTLCPPAGCDTITAVRPAWGRLAGYCEKRRDLLCVICGSFCGSSALP